LSGVVYRGDVLLECCALCRRASQHTTTTQRHNHASSLYDATTAAYVRLMTSHLLSRNCHSRDASCVQFSVGDVQSAFRASLISV